MANANWSNPTLTSTYTNFVTEVKNRDEDLALQFDGTTSTNIPTNTIRWDSSANRWKKWNGTSWAELTSTYALTALSTTGNASIGGIASVPAGSATAASVAVGTGTTYAPGIYSPGTDQLALATGGSGRLFVDSSGNVGVGGAANVGSAPFGVYVNTATQNGFAFKTTTDGAFGALRALNNAGTETCNIQYDTSNQFIALRTANNERVRITSGGLVGIGTTSPAQLLDVQGGANRTPIAFRGSGTTSGYLYADNSSFAIKTSAGSVSGPDALIGVDTGNYAFIYTNSLERARIDSSGRLGIGTTSPGFKLDLKMSGAARTDGLVIRRSDNDNHQLGLWTSGGAMYFDAVTDNPSAAGQTIFRRSLDSGSTFSESARIDSSGRLLVGTSDGSGGVSKLVVQGASNGSAVGVAQISYNGLASAVLAAGTDIGYLRFTDQGSNSGVFAQITATADATTGAGDYPGRLVFSTTADGASSPTERMRIDNIGTHQVYANNHVIYSRTAAAAGTTYAVFSGNYGATSTTTGTLSSVIWSNGNVQNTNGSYTSTSDAKLKEDIVDANSQWNDLKAIKIRKWNYKAETNYETHRQIGPIAQELEQICPGLVFETPDRDEEGNETGEFTKGVNLSVLYMKAVKALQEAMERIEQLEAKVAALEAK